MITKTSDLCDQYSDSVNVLSPLFQDFGAKADFEDELLPSSALRTTPESRRSAVSQAMAGYWWSMVAAVIATPCSAMSLHKTW